ncbi:MAG: type II toxin-antitoxin system HicB family antitoxin [Sphingomicrobium sp.]
MKPRLIRRNIVQATAVLTPAEEGGFVAFNPETGTTTQGESIEEALANLREAVELFLEVSPMKSLGASFVTTFSVAEHA